MIDTTEEGAVGQAFFDGVEAAQAVVGSGAPNLDALDDYAQAMEVLRVGVARGRMSFGWVEPTEDDVRNARDLVGLVRDGAPAEALIEPARRAARVATDAWELGRFQAALFCLEDEALRVAHLARIEEVLDLTIALFERGCNVAGFVPAPSEHAGLRGLREIAGGEGADAPGERRRLVEAFLARMPPCNPAAWREDAVKSLYLR